MARIAEDSSIAVIFEESCLKCLEPWLRVGNTSYWL